MGITIHYYTEHGNHLDPATARDIFTRAAFLAKEIAGEYGWEFAGMSRSASRWYMEHVPGGSTVQATGAVRSALWNPSPGCESFELQWVEGTGILPYAFTKTQYAEDRVRVHAEICDLLTRLNTEVFDGKLSISDEGHFLPERAIDRLAHSFGENEDVIRRMVDAARGAGWTVSSPLDGVPPSFPPRP